MGNALTLGDVLGCLRAGGTFGLLLLIPGHLLGWATNLAGFRRRGPRQQAAWSVALSFAVMPILATMVAKVASLQVVIWLSLLCVAVSLPLMVWGDISRLRRRATKLKLNRTGVIAIAIAVVWAGFVIAELVDVCVGNHLYLSVTVFDHALRTSFVDAVMRTGVPPSNPLYWPGHAAPMRYYYFWYVLTAAAARLAGATARQAMIASAVWSGFGLASAVALYCRHFLSPRSSRPSENNAPRWPRTAIALALLFVTGLDLLPALAKALLHLPTDADMEWWSPDQVSSWMDSLLWVPHHVAGLVCGLFGFLLVWMSKGLGRLQRVLCALIAGLAFASAFGLSTWVAAAFAMVLFAWMVWAIVFEPASRTRVPVLLGAGLVAVLSLTPYLTELRHVDSATAASGEQSIVNNASQILRFGVRHMIDPDSLASVPGFASLARSHPRLEDSIAGLILLLPGYFVELGFFGIVLIVALVASRRSGLDESARTSLVLVVAGLIATSLLRSTVISNNDFGIRSILIAQFFLLMLAVEWFEGAFGATNKPLRAVMQAMVWIGVAGTIYQAVELRLYLPVEDHLGRPEVAGLAERAMALRRGFDAMDARIPPDAVIQFNTAQPGDYFRYPQMMQARRQIATALPECASAFGGNASPCPAIRQAVERLFAASSSLNPTQAARAECSQLGVTHLVATRWDAVWSDPQSWVWTLPAAVDTGDLRVLDCTQQAP